jgi:hypothetical protein
MSTKGEKGTGRFHWPVSFDFHGKNLKSLYPCAILPKGETV